MVLVSKAPALVWEAQMTGAGKLGQLVPKKPWPYVNHYSFHILDPDWGHLTIKMSGHPPFGAQVMLNGHEYVACAARKAGIEFTKQDNCFTTIYYNRQCRGVGAGRRYLVSRRDCRASAPALRALDLYNMPLLCSGSGGAKAERLFIQLLSLPDGIQPQSAVPVRQPDGTGIPGAD